MTQAVHTLSPTNDAEDPLKVTWQDALSVDRLSMAYNKREIVHDVAFRISSHEVVGLVGPNGCGKTTLLRGAAGLVANTHGSIRYGAYDIMTLNGRQRAQWRGYVPQNVQPTQMTEGLSACRVDDVVAMGLAHQRQFFGADRSAQAVGQALAEVGISAFAARLWATLSGGEQQLAMLARALVHGPRLLLLDEPTSALDVHHRLLAFRLLRRRASENGVGVLMAMHDLNMAAIVCDRLLLMHEGRIVCEGKPSDVLTEDNIQRVYGVHVVRAMHPIHSDCPTVFYHLHNTDEHPAR